MWRKEGDSKPTEIKRAKRFSDFTCTSGSGSKSGNVAASQVHNMNEVSNCSSIGSIPIDTEIFQNGFCAGEGTGNELE